MQIRENKTNQSRSNILQLNFEIYSPTNRGHMWANFNTAGFVFFFFILIK